MAFSKILLFGAEFSGEVMSDKTICLPQNRLSAHSCPRNSEAEHRKVSFG